jgi:hypothetical protein
MTMSRFAGKSFCDSCGKAAMVRMDRVEIAKIDGMKGRAKTLRSEGWEVTETADGFRLVCPSCLGGPKAEDPEPAARRCTYDDVVRVIAQGNGLHSEIVAALKAEGFDVRTDGRLSVILYHLKKKGILEAEPIPGLRINRWSVKQWQDQ